MTSFQTKGLEKLEAHLGDGLFIKMDESVGKIKLRTPTMRGDQMIWLDANQLDAMLEWLGNVRAMLFAGGKPQ
jgi:hypothetical protein